MTKEETREKAELRRKTKDGVIAEIYSSQRSSSRKRGHKIPTYSLAELREWASRQPNFDVLYNEWVASGYESPLKPSIDRFDDYKGYSFDNIQLITWRNNYSKEKPKVKGRLNGRSKLKEYYATKPTLRKDFKITCKRQGWDFDDFTESFSGTRRWTHKLRLYKEKI